MARQSLFEHFIRTGGTGAITVPWNAPPGYRTKSERIIETSVASLLGPADADNIAYLMQFLGKNAAPAIANVDVSDIDAWAGERLRARLSGLEEDDVAQDEVAQAVVRQYTAQLNARRQQILGISHYIWRTRDDNRVRTTHAARDDRIFAWDEPLSGGFPGEDFGCRCIAEPVVDGPACSPKTGVALVGLMEGAALVGYLEAARDYGIEAVAGLFDLAVLAGETVDFVVSELTVLLGIAGERREADVERVHDWIVDELAHFDESLSELVAALKALPDLAAAFVDYVDAVAERAASARGKYLRCEIGESDLKEAIREEAYLRASILIAVVPGAAIAAKVAGRAGGLLRAAGRAADDLSPARKLRAATRLIVGGAVPRGFRRIRRGSVDWPNPVLKERGLSYEADLAGRADREGLGTWLELEYRDHPGIDFFDFETQRATSAKTLDLSAYSYQTRPSQVYATLGRYLRDLAEFDNAELILPGSVNSRALRLAVPAGATPELYAQVDRAIDLAESLGIEMIVEVTQ